MPPLYFMNRPNNRQGSVLLLTLLIVSLMMTIILSFVVYVRMNLSSMDQHAKNVQAQRNAMVALQIAIGELQETAGPDQRITTTADAVATYDIANGTATPDGIFPSETERINVQAGGRYWTAVWGNGESEIGYDLGPEEIPPFSGSKSGVTPVLMNWLVSGNENVSYQLHPNAEGGVDASSVVNIEYDPSVVNVTNPSNPTIAGDTAVLLVGPNTVGGTSANTQSYVAAPLVDMPSGTPGNSDGRYAWWVGDEGVKARMNLTNGYQQSQEIDDEIHSFLVGQRSGVEFMSREPVGISASTYVAEYPGNDAKVGKLQHPEQLALLGADASAQNNLKNIQQNRFHDLSTYSLGVLSDVYAGGLKKDLTADIADTSSGGGYRPADDDRIYPALGSAPTDPQSSKWGLIRSWARTNPSSPGGAISPEPPTSETAGVYPTVAYFSMGFDYMLDGNQLKFCLYPIISLHNPYPVPIAASDYDLGLRVGESGVFTVQINPGAPTVDGGGNTVYNYQDVATIDMNKLELKLDGQGSTAGSTFIRLKLKGELIPPGQRQIYVLPDALLNSSYSHNSPPVLELASDSGSIGESLFFVLNGPTLDLSAVDLAEARIRLRVSTSENMSAREGIKFSDISLLLAENNALSGSTWDPTASGIYQGFYDIYPSVNHTITFRYPSALPGSEQGSGFFCATTALGPLVRDKQDRPAAASSAFRIATGYEGGYWWSSHWKMGFIYGAYNGRFIADGNLRGPHVMATAIENYDPRPDGGWNGPDSQVASGIFGTRIADAVQDQGRDPHPGVYYTGNTTGAGLAGPDAYDVRYSILWDLLDSPDRLLSLGQLQHVPFSRYDWQPSYLFGNSYATKRISRDQIYNGGKLRKIGQSPRTAPTLPIYDESWLLNRQLWDRYFVSGVPSDLTQADLDAQLPLPNARMTPYQREGDAVSLNDIQYSGGSNDAYDNAAANLMVTGAFNINSTSEQAWRAFLAGTYGIPLNPDYAEAGDQVSELIPYPRFTHNLSQPGNSVYPPLSTTMRMSPDPSGTGDSQYYHKVRSSLYIGNRGLYFNAPNNALPENPSAEAVVAELARSIVHEIRLRGPFLSVADFVNRPLTEPSSSKPYEPFTGTPDPAKIAGIKGVLQAGIDNMDPNRAQVNPYTYIDKGLIGHVVASSGQDGQNPPRYYYNWDREHGAGGVINGSGEAWESYRSTASMGPKFLTQGDLLSTLGPALTARSDTFTIRAYGEKLNQLGTEVEGRAWCEAVVQRFPEYVDESQLPTEDPTGLNLALGRRFRIVSFRWLNPSDI